VETAQALDALLAQVGHAATLPQLSQILGSLPQRYGVATVLYHALALPPCAVAHPILLPSLPEEPNDWLQRYRARDYFRIDPVLKVARHRFLPVDWSEVDHETPDARRFFQEAEACGVGRHGVTLPVYGPAGEHALFTVTANVADAQWPAARLTYLPLFHMIAHFVHDRAAELSGYRHQRQQIKLSQRELQCLSQVVKGRHGKQIAGLLGISPNMVQFYLQGARQKLDCTSVTAAVAKAVRLEIIRDDDADGNHCDPTT